MTWVASSPLLLVKRRQSSGGDRWRWHGGSTGGFYCGTRITPCLSGRQWANESRSALASEVKRCHGASALIASWTDGAIVASGTPTAGQRLAGAPGEGGGECLALLGAAEPLLGI